MRISLEYPPKIIHDFINISNYPIWLINNYTWLIPSRFLHVINSLPGINKNNVATPPIK